MPSSTPEEKISGSSVFRPLLHFALCVSSFGWFYFMSFYCNKTVILTIARFLSSLSYSSELLNPRESVGTLSL